ncbi:MAG TPA: glycosyltransferase family 9 protein [Ktedonobacteraceae bacterium]|nr:glycosyltransferase family 9 protein [Ktedonobacteraceae bacterium]
MIRTIALFRALYLGDMLLAVPALRALRQRFPEAEITLIGLPWAAELVEHYPAYLDRFVPFEGYPGLPEVEVKRRQTRTFLRAQRAYRYDLAVQMHGSGASSNAFVRDLRAKLSVGYFPPGDKAARKRLDIGEPYPADQHEIERNLGLARLLGATRLDPRLEFPLLERDVQECERLLETLSRKDRLWIGLHAGAKCPARRWPPAYFAQLADALADKLGARILLTGSAGEAATVRQVADQMSSKPLNLVGKTSLGGLAALLSRLDLFISNDTGPAHLASALDTPSITLMGPTDYQRWSAQNQQRHPVLRAPVACSPCAHQVCPIDHRCLNLIRPALVEEVASELLRQNPALFYRHRRNMPVSL